MHSALRPFTGKFSNFAAAASSGAQVVQSVTFLGILAGSRGAFFVVILALAGASLAVVGLLHVLTSKRSSGRIAVDAIAIDTAGEQRGIRAGRQALASTGDSVLELRPDETARVG